ncbi:DUF5301 domain-containing protein [Anaerococcus ihuae]|uniref:DUF5301 domain-containing protein n=1 Tax=Anaerococcus ihuae TaxID=2899519 RepID=UPI001F4794E7|nr:DUF5301 domain-containing protein [Anaerococcus ihuae]
MSKKKKSFLIITTILIISISFILKNKTNNGKVKTPRPDDISSITFIKVIDNRGINRRKVYKKSHINKFLNTIKNSERTNNESISNFPDKNEFIITAFKLKEGGFIISSIYEEDNSIYFEQAFNNIFKLNSNYNLDLLLEMISEEENNKEDISVNIEDLTDSDF